MAPTSESRYVYFVLAFRHTLDGPYVQACPLPPVYDPARYPQQPVELMTRLCAELDADYFGGPYATAREAEARRRELVTPTTAWTRAAPEEDWDLS